MSLVASTINLVQLTKEEAELLRDERIAAFNERCVFVKPKHTGFLVLQRIEKQDGTTFIAPTFCDTKQGADMFASNFDNVVSIMPIEWEE